MTEITGYREGVGSPKLASCLARITNGGGGYLLLETV